MRRPLVLLGMLMFLGRAGFGCATGGDSSAGDGGSDAGIGLDGMPSDTTLDQTFDRGPDAGRDAVGFDAADVGIDSGTDSGVDVSPPLDAPPTDGPPSEAGDGGCGATGQPCSTMNPFSCPLAYFCQQSVMAGSNDGVCLSAISFPSPCNDGTDQCPTGQACLNASMICLSAMETACVCNNPQESAACGWPDAGTDAAPGDAAAEGAAEAGDAGAG